MVQEAEASQKRLNEFLKIEPEIKNKKTKSIINGSISFKKSATLMKTTNIKALQNISFRKKARH
jgi:ATP-binding cassette subfamily B protein